MLSMVLQHIPSWIILVQALLLLIIPLLLLKLTRWLRKALNGRHSARSDMRSAAEMEKKSGKDSTHTAFKLTGQYAAEITLIREHTSRNADVKIREFTIKGTQTRVAVLTIDGLCDNDIIDTHLITPLMLSGVPESEADGFAHSSLSINSYLKTRLLPVTDIAETQTLGDLVQSVLIGTTGLLVEGMEGAFLLFSAGGKSRSLEEPLSEALLRGPRVGFTERLADNTGLLRLHGKNESLSITRHQVGTRVKKDLVIAYMKDIADDGLVQEVTQRIQRMDIDDPLESGYVEQLIEDNILSPFQQVHNTERPDRVIGALLEGRVAILLDGTPFALIVPVTFSMLLQSPEDYYERWISGSFVRLLRMLAAMLALLAPALYVSFISFHPGLIPTRLALSIIETRQGVPFPSLLEVLIMEIAIEILREAGIRLPKPIGPAMGIVGGLIIGDAAVNAGIVSPFLVIVVAVTAISSFTIPSYSAGISLRFLRFIGMFCAAFLGLFGVVMFFLFLCSHIVKLRSFGVPYASPLVPYRFSDWKDLLIRLPLQVMKERPQMIKTKDSDRKK